jgi:hypothetical protein
MFIQHVRGVFMRVHDLDTGEGKRCDGKEPYFVCIIF